jgi:hypothetical protein
MAVFFKEARMKNKWFLWGITGAALVFGLIFAGCDNGSVPATYTVTFDGGDGSGDPPAAQAVESGQSVTMPGKGSLEAPSGKDFDGWRGDGQALAIGDSYTVTRDVTFIAQWRAAFVAVTGISGVPAAGTVGTAVNLDAVVSPASATNRTVLWSVKTPGAGVTAISGTSFTPTEAGTLVLTAAIADGAAAGSPYTQDFSITVGTAAPAFTSSVNEDTANNAATLGLVGDSVSASPTGIVDGEITTAGKIKITSVSAGSAVLTVSNSAGMSAAIAVTVAADGSISLGTISPQSNPFIGVWIDTTWDEAATDWDRTTNYKFESDLIYSTTSAAAAVSGDFTIGGTYEFNTATNRLILRPQGQGAVSRQITYALDRSTLIFNESEVYTKNPETGGGVNGSNTGTFAGIWKDVANADVPMGFNGDGEYFEPLPQKSRDNKTWWFVVADYTYDSAHEELTIEHNPPKTYKVTLEMAGRQVKLTYPSTGVETTFEKQDF